jgi:hypothetical protein
LRLLSESLIARFSIQGELSVSDNWTQYASNNKQAPKEIEFEYRVTCDSNYYGAGCETLCRERDDNFGHYACSATGQRMCLSGWQGDYCSKRKSITSHEGSLSLFCINTLTAWGWDSAERGKHKLIDERFLKAKKKQNVQQMIYAGIYNLRISRAATVAGGKKILG